MKKKLVFLCGARDFHAMDWYKSSLELVKDTKISIVTDLIAGENFSKIVSEKDDVHKLLILDPFLFKNQSSLGDKWRNILKLCVLPIQVILLRIYAKKNPGTIYHAHAMYYLVLARAAGLNYIGTPQGSDILVKPYRSSFFKKFAKYGMLGAKNITVDSIEMQKGVSNLTGQNAILIQNGIDINEINKTLKTFREMSYERELILSIRGFTELYRIKDILVNRNKTLPNEKLTFIYPFYDDIYKLECSKHIQNQDVDLGRVNRETMYELLLKTILVISIPQSDSSPRSVYEAIFCGCIVAIEYNTYYELLPDCMKKRIIIVDLKKENWLQDSLTSAKKMISEEYTPSKMALENFDQRKSFKKLEQLLFNY